MKKIWNDGTALGSMEIALVASIVLIGGSVYALVHTWEETEEYDECDGFSITWYLSGCSSYIIEFVDVKPTRTLEDVQWSILDPNLSLATWEDPSGEILRMEGDLSDINFSQAGFDGADVHEDDKFYSQDPTGTPPVSINHTLCIVYMDVSSDGKLTPGDVIWIRSYDNDGVADEDYRFRLSSGRCLWGEMLLPAT